MLINCRGTRNVFGIPLEYYPLDKGWTSRYKEILSYWRSNTIKFYFILIIFVWNGNKKESKLIFKSSSRSNEVTLKDVGCSPYILKWNLIPFCPILISDPKGLTQQSRPKKLLKQSGRRNWCREDDVSKVWRLPQNISTNFHQPFECTFTKPQKKKVLLIVISVG